MTGCCAATGELGTVPENLNKELMGRPVQFLKLCNDRHVGILHFPDTVAGIARNRGDEIGGHAILALEPAQVIDVDVHALGRDDGSRRFTDNDRARGQCC